MTTDELREARKRTLMSPLNQRLYVFNDCLQDFGEIYDESASHRSFWNNIDIVIDPNCMGECHDKQAITEQ